MSIRELFEERGATGWVRTSVLWVICFIGLVAVPFLSLPAEEVHWTKFRGVYTETDLAIGKFSIPIVYEEGEVTYLVAAINIGPADVVGAQVDDVFPAGLDTVSWTCTGTDGGTCTPSGTGDIVDAVNLPVGGSVQYTAVASLLPGTVGVLENQATITPPNGLTDPQPSNNSATASTAVALFVNGFESGDTSGWSSATLP